MDELHATSGVIVEVYGDHSHAKHGKYSDNDQIWIPGRPPYTAGEVRQRDAERQARLEALGYRVIVVWESDNLLEKYQEIVEAIQG